MEKRWPKLLQDYLALVRDGTEPQLDNELPHLKRIGDISPTDRRAAMVWPAHIHIAMISVK